MSFFVTATFVALFALIQFLMTIPIGMYRAKTDIHFLDGGDRELVQRMRAYGNFTETVPIALLAMAAAEYVGTALALLWLGGAMLLVGRLVHYVNLRGTGWGLGRILGMLLTFTVICGFAIRTLLASANII